MSKYSMGIDFGTLSARAVIVDIATGEEIATSVMEYRNGVMSDTLPCGKNLGADYALQHPADYLETLYFVTKDSIKKSKINASDIVGVGVDFTASTVIPVLEDGTPLCYLDEFKENPHAYVKLWKHHAAQKEADEINSLANELGEEWLKQYGGIISSEWLLPKVLETLRNDEEVYDRTYRFIEAGDWIVWKLTGCETHSVCNVGFKSIWNEKTGYPCKEFFKKLDARLENIVGNKISEDIVKMSETAGFITSDAENLTGLKTGTAVSSAIIDAHAALPALGITKSEELLMIIGTSSCHILLADEGKFIPGISGYVYGGIADDIYAYEAGQSCVGDSFDWFIKNCLPEKYYSEAEKNGLNIHEYLRKKAQQLPPGSNGVIALDWWNGNRTPYVDGSLKGCLFGLDINTKPEEIYKALIEATAYGTKRIVEIYEENGINIKKIYAAGGIADKDEMLMQIYTDVLDKEIFISGTSQACAHGSAIRGAVNEKGYTSLEEASSKMKKVKETSYKPIKENTALYNDLYKVYKELSEYFSKKELFRKIKY